MGINHVLKIPNQLCAVPQVTIVGPNAVPRVFISEPSTFTSDPVGRPYVDFNIENSAYLGSPLFRPRRRVPEWTTYPGMFYRFGMIAEERGDLDRAILFYSWERNPRFIVPAYTNMAAIHCQGGKIEEAIQWLGRALEAAPDHSETALNLGKCYFNSAQPEEAVPYFERYLASDPENGDAHFFLAYALHEAGRLDESVQSYEGAIRCSDDPDIQRNAYYNLGVVYEAMEEHDKAVNAYWKVLGIDPYNAEACYNLGTIVFDLDLLEEAEELFEIAVAQRPDDIDSRYALGVSYFERGRYTYAAEQFEHLFALDPTHVRTKIYLGLISLFSEQWEEAEKWFGVSYRKFREDYDYIKAETIEVMLLLAQAGLYDKKREWAAARACLQSASYKLELEGKGRFAEQIRYISVCKGEQLRLSEVIGGASGELVGDFMENVGLGGSLRLYANLRKEQEAKLRWAYLESGSADRFRTKAAGVIAATRAMGADIKRKAIELFHQYEQLHQRTPLGLSPERQKYPASKFFSGLIGDVFYDDTIRGDVEKRLGVKPAKLSAGISFFDAPDVLLAQLWEGLHEFYKDYSHPFGGGNVRGVIADYENNRAEGEVYSASNVAVTLGATGAIYFAYKFMEELRRRNPQFTHVLAPVPAYYASASIATYLGFNVVEIMSGDSKLARFLPTPTEISEAMKADGRIKMLSLANPNNPTGEIYGHDELSEIVSIAKFHGAYILYDEIFSDLMLTEEKVPNIVKIAEAEGCLDHLMRVTSWSKDRCMPGFRVGYLVADESILSEIMEFPEWLYANPPTVLNGVIERDLTYRQMMEPAGDKSDSQDIDFLMYKRQLLENMVLYNRNLEIVREKLGDEERFTVLQPKAAFNMFVRLRDVENFDQYDFAKRLFIEKGVEIHPGPGFGWTQQKWEHEHGFWIRITFAVEQEELERGLNGLLEFIEECKVDPNKVKKRTARS